MSHKNRHNHPNPVPPLLTTIAHEEEAEIFLQLASLSVEERQLAVQEHILRNLIRGNILQRENLQINQANMGFLSELVQLQFQISKSAKLIFTGASTMANDLVLNVGQSSTATPTTFLADGTTPAGATISAATYTFSDPSATVVSSDGVTAVVTGIAASAGAVSGSVSFTATDTDGAVSQWTVPFTVTTNSVTPPPPEQLSQSAGLTFSTPA